MGRYKNLNVTNLEELERETVVGNDFHYTQSNLPYETDMKEYDEHTFNKVKRVIRQPMSINQRGGSSVNQQEHYHHNQKEQYHRNQKEQYHIDSYGNQMNERSLNDNNTPMHPSQQNTGMIPCHITQPDDYSCMDVATHVQNCPICTRFYGSENNNNSYLYIIIIIILSLFCILLTKKVIDDK